MINALKGCTNFDKFFMVLRGMVEKSHEWTSKFLYDMDEIYDDEMYM